VALVNGSGKDTKRGPVSVGKSSNTGRQKVVTDPAENNRNKNLAVLKTMEVSPEHIIPLDDEDFKDF
jgi:hypothetical protein